MQFDLNRGLLIGALSLALVACSDDGGNSAAPNPAAYPTGADSYEGSGGDNTLETAGSLDIGKTQKRTLWPQGDWDWVSVTLEAGTDYEFSASRLCASCDTFMYLYDAEGIQLASNDDHVNLDSAIQFTPEVSGTYYVAVRAYDANYGVASYTLGARLLVDNDADGWSTYHDCNDNDDTIMPWSGDEILGDDIDQSCAGTNLPDPTVADSAEPDNTPETAKTLYQLSAGNPWEFIWYPELYRRNTRTLHDAADLDYFKFTVPANSAGYLEYLDWSGDVWITLYDSDGTTELDSDSSSFFVENSTAGSKTYYVSFEQDAGTPVTYTPAFYSIGTDKDGDGFYSRDWDNDRDCNDNDAAINPGVFEVGEDGIDNNCNGQIDEPIE